jgi:hypothetical protein
MELSLPNSAPIITPTLCAKSLQFDMVNVHDLEEGIQPFIIGSRSTAASRSARATPVRKARCKMVDINTFRNSDKVAIPTKLFHVASALRQYRVLLYMLLESTHPLTIEFDRFCTAWPQNEAALDELGESTEFFAALVVRWVQLRLTYWFSE